MPKRIPSSYSCGTVRRYLKTSNSSARSAPVESPKFPEITVLHRIAWSDIGSLEPEPLLVSRGSPSDEVTMQLSPFSSVYASERLGDSKGSTPLNAHKY